MCNSYFQKIVVALLSAIMCCLWIVPSAQASDDSITQDDILEQSLDYQQALDTIGITDDDLSFAKANGTNLDYFASFTMQYYGNAKVAESAVSSLSTLQCSASQRFMHAQKAAKDNETSDDNARGAGAETVYMYLSHYVDIPVDKQDGTCDSQDESEYLANWITSDDRNVYDSFLNVMNLTSLPTDTLDTINKVTKIIEAPSKAEKMWNDSKKFGVISTIASSAASLHGYKEDIIKIANDLSDAYSSANADPQKTIEQIDNKLSLSINSEETRKAVTLTAAVISSSLSGTMLSIGLNLVELNSLYLSSIQQVSAVAAMQASLSGRVSGRLMRGWGM